jgi:methylated-DNA-protein-cysteine methyltransferase related protein
VTREAFYEQIRRIPRGRVATYGGIARLAGVPLAAREVGWALSALSEDSDVPWWRVVNRRGTLSCPRSGAALQAALLHQEGVELEPDGSLDLARYLWDG